MALQDFLPWRKGSTPEQRSETRSVVRLQDQMNDLFDRFWKDWPGSFGALSDFKTAFAPQMEVHTNAEAVTVSAELPGMTNDDIELTLDHDQLVLTGEKRQVHTSDEDDRYYTERRYGSFRRVIPLPAQVDVENVEASFTDGLLTVRLPLVEPLPDRRRKIPISS